MIAVETDLFEVSPPPVAVAERVLVAVYEDRPVDPADAATVALWVQKAAQDRVDDQFYLRGS